MLQVGDWGDGEVFVEVGLDGPDVLAEGDVHYQGALGMADVVDFAASDIIDILHGSRQIELSHLPKRKHPLRRSARYRLPRILIPPAIAQPHIVTLIRENKPNRLILLIDQPGIGALQHSVMQIHRGQVGFESTALLLNSEESQ